MGTFAVDLPYRVTLQAGRYRAVVRGVEIVVEHSVIEQELPDPRLGGVSGRFGLGRDPLGVLRYSRLEYALDQQAQDRLERVFFGDLLRARRRHPSEIRAQVGLAVSNHFLNRYRASVNDPLVRPLGERDLAFLRYEDGQTTEAFRLYGDGGITLPPAGLPIEQLQAFMDDLAVDTESPAYRLAILDAARAASGGSGNEAIIAAVGALETALDVFFGAAWRGGMPRVLPPAAGRELCLTRKRLSTVDDVLKAAVVRKKLDAFGKRHGLGAAEEEDLDRALDARNVVVHGGVTVPPLLAETYVRTIARFLDGPFAAALEAVQPAAPRPSLLDAPTRRRRRKAVPRRLRRS